MKTTVNLPDALLEAAKQRAADEQRTLTSLIEEGLRQVLAGSGDGSVPTLPSWGSGDGRVLVDLADRDAVWDALDGDERTP
jgi:hypothetical protein